MSGHSRTKKTPITKIIASIAAVAIVALGGFFIYKSFLAPSGDKLNDAKVTQEAPKQAYTASAEEKEYLANKFKGLLATNSETVGYVYIPGTQLDEPVVQTTDNATYLDKRFDGVIEFKALSKENLLQIVDLMLDDVNKRLSSNNIHLDVTDNVKEKLVDLGYDPKMGARPLRRTIQDYIEDAITDYYLENPSEKELKAVMTSKGKIVIKSKNKTETIESND